MMISEAEFISGMRRRDPASGLILPWFTHGALDEILTWDLVGKTVLEWGGGESTAWWASRCERVFTVEYDGPQSAPWRAMIEEMARPNVELFTAPLDRPDLYPAIPHWRCVADIFVIDGDHRAECLRTALSVHRPLTIIFDNWQQGPDFIDPVAAEMMAPFEGRVYPQPNHTDHDGRPWQTAIWRLP